MSETGIEGDDDMADFQLLSKKETLQVLIGFVLAVIVLVGFFYWVIQLISEVM